jgi:mannose-6-phosphate isomerase-like protein (cupin superfamily)
MPCAVRACEKDAACVIQGKRARRTIGMLKRSLHDICAYERGLMRRTSVAYQSGFRVLIGDGHSQAATMVIAPGAREGGPDNRHRGADQWLYVESGIGEAIVNGHTYALEAHALVLIQRGDTHEIRNTGSTPLATLNIYVPPAYTSAGDELPPGVG